MYAELPWVLERTRRLAERTYARLAALPGVRMAVGPSEHAALLAWSVEGWSAAQATDELSHSVFAILDADPAGERVRAGLGAWNTEDELARFTDRVAELAAHTPASLPRRPSLTILGARPEDAG
jgi:selenocysteine lyase/cysteine desulfurase